MTARAVRHRQTEVGMTQELIERLRNASQLAQKKYVTNSSELFDLAADALQSQSARIAELEGDWQLSDESAPHACHVLAARFDDSFGEWIYGIVLSPPSKPFTHWKPLPSPPRSSLTKDSTSG